MAAALPGLTCRARFAFTAGGDDSTALKAEIAALNFQLVEMEFATAIKEGRCLPRDRHAFQVRMGAAATLEEARKWIGGSPRTAPIYRPTAARATVDDDASVDDESLPPGEQVKMKVARAVAKSGGRLTFREATRQVLKANPELADRYRYEPGQK